jgi:hypothetical protein
MEGKKFSAGTLADLSKVIKTTLKILQIYFAK